MPSATLIISICSFLLVLSVTAIIWGRAESNDFEIIGWIGSVVVVLFGFGVICGAVPVGYKNTEYQKIKITKGQYSVLVEFNNGENLIFTDAKSYNMANENSLLIKKQDFNSYGLEINAPTYYLIP